MLRILMFAVMAAACQADEPPRENAAGHPYVAGEEVICEDPYSGFSHRDEAVARGVTPDIGIPEGMEEVFPMAMGVIAEDGDGDGDIDLLFPSGHGGPQIFENDGAGQFARVEATVEVPGAAEFLPSASLGWVDLTNDGLPDLLAFAHHSVLFAENQGGMRFGQMRVAWIDTSQEIGATVTGAWQDADGDGDLDLLLPGTLLLEGQLPGPGQVQRGAPERLLWNDQGVFEDGPRLVPSGDEAALLMVALWTDVDGDGDPDVLAPSLRGSRGFPPTALYRNEGDGVFSDVGPEVGAALALSGMGMDSADLDGDGTLDHCITDLGGIRCLLNDGTGAFYEGAQSLGLVPPGVSATWSGWSMDLADLDNDGHLDAVAAAGYPVGLPEPELDYSQQPDGIWQGLEGGGFEQVDGPEGFDEEDSHYGLVTADLDGDGVLEIVVTGPDGQVHLWKRGCGSGAWLTVDLAGAWDNLSAVGARVEVQVGSSVIVREVHGARGFGQTPARLHFGLGEVEVVDAVRVQWPDGIWTESLQVPLRRHVTIPHPDRLAGSDLPDSGSPWSGSQFTSSGRAGSLVGTLSRTIEPTEDGVGTAWFFVMESNPMEGLVMPVVIAQQEVDFSDANALVNYRIPDIPLRDEAYYVVAALDDDSSGAAFGPESGDLVAMGDTGGFPQVTIDEEMEFTKDLTLNFRIP